jgi:ankyrin repeat protein
MAVYIVGEKLLEASKSGSIEEVKRILSDVKTDKKSIDHQGKDGSTALMWAALKGHDKIVEMLLNDARVDKKSVDHEANNGQTALIWAALKGHHKIVEMLLNDARVDKNTIDHKDMSGFTALILAALKGHHKIVEMLLNDDRVDKNTIDHESKKGYTALIWAALKGHHKIVEMLFCAGATFDRLKYQTTRVHPFYIQKYGFSPLPVEVMDSLSRRHYGKYCDCVIVAVQYAASLCICSPLAHVLLPMSCTIVVSAVVVVCMLTDIALLLAA